ncbi:MAG: cold-shock protein, partial [Bacteroidota bacterium]
NETKGFGFIKHENSNEETFVHVSGILEPIKENDQVEFEMQQGRKGMNAVSVRVLR